MVPGQDVSPLTTLLSALEPVNLGGRQNTSPATQLTPLTALSDAAPPDPASRRQVSAWVQGFLAAPRTGAYRAELERTFDAWRDQLAGLTGLAGASPAVREGLPIATDLADLGTMGLEAVRFLSTGATANAEWKAKATALLDHASRRQAHLRIAVIEPMRVLLTAAAR